MRKLTSIEVCAGAGGQALGLERAGFHHALLIDNDESSCKTLRLNRPHWSVLHSDIKDVSLRDYRGVDLFAGGLPCPPFSVAGKQLGEKDERNLFVDALRMIAECDPRSILIENVRGFLSPQFGGYREFLRAQFQRLGYCVDWRLINASSFGVPQLRPRVMIVAMKREIWPFFQFPEGNGTVAPDVGEVLGDLMGQRGWQGAQDWAKAARGIAPTIVGGSKKHGGPDLGPTRARKAWLDFGVNGKSIADEAPAPDHEGLPRLTVRMVARLQGFPDDWTFFGRKTPAYRQVGNAFPPPVAQAAGVAIRAAIEAHEASLPSGARVAN